MKKIKNRLLVVRSKLLFEIVSCILYKQKVYRRIVCIVVLLVCSERAEYEIKEMFYYEKEMDDGAFSHDVCFGSLR